MKKRFLILIFTSLVLFTASNVWAIDSSITISRQARVKSLEIKIGEVAKIEGSQSFKEKVGGISLGQSPLPGYQRTIYREEIVFALRNNEIDISTIKLDIPHQVNIITESRSVSIDRLIEVGKEHIYNSLAQGKESINIEVLNPPSDLVLPYGELLLNVETSYDSNLIGRSTIPIRVMIDGKVYRRIYMQYRVSVAKDILVAKDNLSRGAYLSNDNFKVREILIDSSNNQYFDPEGDLTGKKMKVSLNEGRPLLERMIETPPLVDRWSDIKIVAKVGGIEISTSGRARQAGHLGEIIQVQNSDSGNIMEARVVAEGIVEVLIN